MALLPAAIQTQQPSTCTQPIVPQVCKPSAAAARGNMPQQQQLLERTGQGSFPHIRHTLHSCFVAHSFILTVPRKNTSQMRGACACPHPAASAATASKGWCSCDPAVTWKDAFTTLCGEQDRIFPVPCLECVRSIPDVARGESQAASCPMSGSRPRDLRQCRSCLGWGKWREA